MVAAAAAGTAKLSKRAVDGLGPRPVRGQGKLGNGDAVSVKRPYIICLCVTATKARLNIMMHLQELFDVKHTAVYGRNRGWKRIGCFVGGRAGGVAGVHAVVLGHVHRGGSCGSGGSVLGTVVAKNCQAQQRLEGCEAQDGRVLYFHQHTILVVVGYKVVCTSMRAILSP